MRRVIKLWSLLAVGCLLLVVGFGRGAEAQQTPTPDVDALQTQVAEQEATISALQTQVADLIAPDAEPTETPQPTEEPADKGPKTYKMGDIATFAGVMELTVTKAEVAPTIATDYRTDTARGQYLIVSIDVVNLGPQPIDSYYYGWVFVDEDGRTFSFDYDATFNYSYKVLGMDVDALQPGLKYSYAIVFDVPTDVRVGVLTYEDFEDVISMRVRV